MNTRHRPPREALQVRDQTSTSRRARRYTEVVEEPLFEVSRFRRKLIGLGYRLASSISMADDPCWRGPLVEALDPQPGERILDFGAGSAVRAFGLAKEFPDTHFVAVDLDSRATRKAVGKASWRPVQNLEIAEADASGRLPFTASAFDKVMSSLSLHLLPPGGKVEMARELWRVLKRGGTLYMANFDKPVRAREASVLGLTRVLFGGAALNSHFDGSWPTFLGKAGFTAVRRLSSHSLYAGRVGLVRARKR